MPTVEIKKERGLVIRDIQSGPVHRSADATKDIDKLIYLVDAAIVDYQRRLSIGEDKYVRVQYISPKEYVESPDLGKDMIFFKLIKRTLWGTSPSTDRKQVKPQTRRQFQDPDDANCLLTEYIDRRENIVEFQVISKHSKRANELALFFEQFMRAYTWYFLDRGINKINYQERMEDRTENFGNDEFSVRPIRYWVLTESIIQEQTRKLQEIELTYDLGLKLKTTTVNEDPLIREHTVIHGS